MNERYWDQLAPNFAHEVFDVLKNDRKKVVLNHISTFASRKLVACDFGCGIGRFLPVLAEQFGHVVAIDISSKCLQIARNANAGFSNIEYLKADLANFDKDPIKPHFAISVNAVIAPDLRQRMAIFEGISKNMPRDGNLLMVVPSLESMLFSSFRLTQGNMRRGMSYDEASTMFSGTHISSSAAIANGIVDLNKTPTKHYLREEFTEIMKSLRLKEISLDKVEYRWSTVFRPTPKWLREPYPWDWLGIFRKY